MSALRHPYTARLLTCLVVDLLLSLTVFIPSGENENKHHLYITTEGRTDDIERAVKSLSRSDIRITNGESGVYLTPVEGWIFILVAGTALSALGWAGLSYIHSRFQVALKTTQP